MGPADTDSASYRCRRCLGRTSNPSVLSARLQSGKGAWCPVYKPLTLRRSCPPTGGGRWRHANTTSPIGRVWCAFCGETLDQGDGNDVDPETHPEYGQLSRKGQQGLLALKADPIEWYDHHKELTNGQHRLCALRAAGIQACPVRGEYLSETDYGVPMDASDHARNSIIESWKSYASKHGRPAWTGVLASKLPRSIRTRVIAAD